MAITTWGTERRRFAARREIEDPPAAVALDDRFVLPDLVEHLWPQPDVADGAEAVARFGDGDALRPLAVCFENARARARSICGRRASARSAPVLSISACRLAISASEHGALGGDLLFGGLELGLALLDAGVELVGLHHDLENAIFARADVVLRGLDLVEHRGVFAVGLHLEQLILVLGEPRLNRSRLLSPPPAASRRRRSSRALTPASASRADCSRASSACVRAGWSAILRRASSAAVSSCCRRMRRSRSGFMSAP